MESEQFDRLARASVGEPTRRTLVRGLAAALGGIGVMAAVDLGADAGKSKKKKKQQKKKKQEQREKKKYECGAEGKVCAAPTDPCKTVSCEQHKCVTSNASDGTVCGDGLACNAGQCGAAICTSDANCGPNGCSCTQTNDGREEVPGTGVCQARTFAQSFSTSADGWFAMLNTDNTWFDADEDNTILVANERAVLKAANAYAPDFDKTAMSPLGGRTEVFPAGGWDVSLDIFLDLEELTAFRRVDYSAAANRTDCTHLRDFIFHVGVNADGTAVCAAVDTGSSPGNQDVCTMAGTVNLTAANRESGWYRFEHRFRDQGGELIVTTEITDLDNGDGSVFEQIIDNNDAIANVGGSRYAFFPFDNFAEGVQIRNSRRENQS